MNHTSSAMKLVSFLTRLTGLAIAAFAIALVAGRYAGAAYVVAISAAFLLIAVRDYAPRARRWQPRLAPAPAGPPARSRHPFRLAA